MKKKIVPLVFIVIVFLILSAFLVRKIFYKPEVKWTQSKLVLPQVENKKGEKESDSLVQGEEDELVSLIPLNGDETLLEIVSMDFNGDGFDDQVNAVKNSDSPYINLLVGLYDSKAQSYERSAIIPTKVQQVKTFSYTGIDLAGDHRVALVYQGFNEEGDSVLQAFYITRARNGRTFLNKIADFEGDGTIFIQQLDRYDAYERSQAKGTPYPIWVYSTDENSKSGNDQLQTRYKWDEEKGLYVQDIQIRVAGSRIAAKELARIQDGTVKTFARFLEGLWYKSEQGGTSYLFFDYESQEIIFYREDTQEVYNWISSRLRRNGIYITTINQEIENIQRRVDISLVNVDEIRLRIQDDVRLIISESSVWDGEYKKLSYSAAMSAWQKIKDLRNRSSSFASEFEKTGLWKCPDGSVLSVEKARWTYSGDMGEDGGSWTWVNADGEPFFQFRSENKDHLLNGTFKVSFGTKNEGRVQVQDKTSLVLEPYTITPGGNYPSNGNVIVLTKNTSGQTAER